MSALTPLVSADTVTTSTNGAGVTLVSGRCRLRNVMIINTSTAGVFDDIALEFKNGSASADTLFKIRPTNSTGIGGTFHSGSICDFIEFPGRGIVFDTGVYLKWAEISGSGTLTTFHVTVTYA